MSRELSHKFCGEIIGRKDIGDRLGHRSGVSQDLLLRFFQGCAVGLPGVRLALSASFLLLREKFGEYSLFALCTQVASQSHGDGSCNEFGHAAKNHDLGVSQSR